MTVPPCAQEEEKLCLRVTRTDTFSGSKKGVAGPVTLDILKTHPVRLHHTLNKAGTLEGIA